jgi:hypothetical protein
MKLLEFDWKFYSFEDLFISLSRAGQGHSIGVLDEFGPNLVTALFWCLDEPKDSGPTARRRLS